MRSLLSYTTLVSTLLSRGGTQNEAQKRDNTTLPAPIVAVPSLHWEGVDGQWSTFEIRLGTPVNTIRVLPATSWQETWVVYGAAAGVCNTSLGVSATCQEARGGVFDSATSSTWETSKQYTLGLNEVLGYSGVGQYGFDTVGLGYTSSTGPTLPHQIVSQIVSDDWWLGMLGMGFETTNFSGYGNPQASFADSLNLNGTISSKSWSYTAGAYYRLKGVFGSLIFGGYDASRFTGNKVRFTMAGDNLRDLVVTVRSITSSNSTGNTTLMSKPELVYIDSSVPELWLPLEVCQEFEKAFGLSLDSKSDLYLLDGSTHSKLQLLNPNITITMSDQKTPAGPTVDISIPYAAFDLNVSAPALPNSTGAFYFPLRRAVNSSQYTLGRTFLQEAYVTAHFNSRTFNVSQCVFSDSKAAEIIALPPTLLGVPSASPTQTEVAKAKKHSALGGGAIAGIVIGVIVLIVLLGAILFFCLRRRRKIQGDKRPESPVHEIDSGKRIGPDDPASAYASQASKLTNEVGGIEKLEKDGWPVMQPQELEAEVPASAMATGPGGAARPSELTIVAEMAGGNGVAHREGEESVISPATDKGTVTDGPTSPNTERNTATAPNSAATERAGRSMLVNTPSPTTSVGGWSLGRRGSRFEENL